MKKIWLAGLALVAGFAHAQQCPDTSALKKARDVVQDLERINTPDGIQESYKTKLGGVEQWVNVRGQDKGNPMVLFIHGGPASPLIPTIWQFQRPWEEYFTIVNYDQRGAGKSYGETDPATVSDSIHIQRYIDDAIELAEYLKTRYHQKKLILMGHSWGTVVGMGAALKRPDLFYAYVGVGQVISTHESERVSFNYALAEAKKQNNAEALKDLESIAPYPGNQPITRERIIVARKWPQYYGGLTAYRNESPYFFDASLLSPEYNDQQRCDIDQGNVFTLGRLLPEFINVDYSGVRQFPIPVFMFMGRHDYTTPSEPTAAWLAKVKAPAKRGVWFEHSAHMIPWEESGKMLITLVQDVRPLAAQKKKAGE